jgi:hypothetical protein
MKPVIYICGKVTGQPYWFAWLKFKVHQWFFELMGYKVLNPCEFVPSDSTYLDAMIKCKYVLNTAKIDAIFAIFDWRWSNGSKEEIKLAARLKIPILNYGCAYDFWEDNCDNNF